MESVLTDPVTGAQRKAVVNIGSYGITVSVDGYGEHTMQDGHGEPIFIEFYDGKLWVRTWADINQEEPTHNIDMQGALETTRV